MEVRINPQKLDGNWRAGWALDLHTVYSIPSGDESFDTRRTEIGELLYQLKYKNDKSKIEPIAEAATNFLKTRLVLPYLDAIIPVPPSIEREFQPVEELAKKIGEKVKLPVVVDYLIKVKETKPLKTIEDSQSRREQLEGAFKVRDDRFAGKYILLFDDLIRSGETLNAITDVLMQDGNVKKVFVLTITKTRSRR